MKFVQQENIYKSGNVTFNPATQQAYSYSWWRFVDSIGGYTVFNNYQYSNITKRHQSKVKTLMRDLGLSIDIEIESPNGLQDLPSAIRHYERKIEELNKKIDNPRSRAKTNLKRVNEIERYRNLIKGIKILEQFKGETY